MSSSDAWWLSFWERLATVCFVLVIVGCVVEGVEHFIKFKKGESRKRHLIEKIGWLLLVAALFGEFVGDQKAKRILHKEDIRKGIEVEELRFRAAIAESNLASLNLRTIEVARRYDLSTNALAEANARLASIRPLKARLIQWLDSVDPEILVQLKKGQTMFHRNMRLADVSILTALKMEPEAVQFFASPPVVGSTLMLMPGGARYTVDFELRPELLK